MKRTLTVLATILSYALLLLAAPEFVSSFAQDPSVRPGETALRLNIEGKGAVVIKLHTKEAPRTTARIIELVQQKFYDGQRFYRVIKTPRPFLIQTGDPASRVKDPNDRSLGTGGTGQFLAYEASGFGHKKYAVGLSSSPNDRDKGDSQFYILLGDQPFLDGNYTVFGQVVQGMSVVDSIELGDRISNAVIVRGDR